MRGTDKALDVQPDDERESEEVPDGEFDPSGLDIRFEERRSLGFEQPNVESEFWAYEDPSSEVGSIHIARSFSPNLQLRGNVRNVFILSHSVASEQRSLKAAITQAEDDDAEGTSSSEGVEPLSRAHRMMWLILALMSLVWGTVLGMSLVSDIVSVRATEASFIAGGIIVPMVTLHRLGARRVSV